MGDEVEKPEVLAPTLPEGAGGNERRESITALQVPVTYLAI